MYHLDRLRALHLVWRHGTIAAAAERLHLTPSAVSQQLTKLERETGTTLLVPVGRGVRLTAAGELLARRADRILDELRAARRDLEALSENATGAVHVGAIPSAVHTFIATAMTALVARCPDVEPHLTEVEPERGLPMLAGGDLDLVVVESWDNLPLARQAGTAWSPLLDDTACVALPLAHPRAEGDSVHADDLVDELWVGWDRGSRAAEWLAQTVRERGVEPEIRYAVTGYSTQFAVVAQLGAVTVVPAMAAAVAPPTVRLLPLRPVLRRTLYAVHPQGDLRPAVAECLAAFREAASSSPRP